MTIRNTQILASCLISTAAAREFYQELALQPRAHPLVEDAPGGKFYPTPPPLARPVTYNTPGFATERLHAAPAPGVHPRVLVTPPDLDSIRARVAQGDAALPEFRTPFTAFRKPDGRVIVLAKNLGNTTVPIKIDLAGNHVGTTLPANADCVLEITP